MKILVYRRGELASLREEYPNALRCHVTPQGFFMISLPGKRNVFWPGTSVDHVDVDETEDELPT